jgi:hypothetical protein
MWLADTTAIAHKKERAQRDWNTYNTNMESGTHQQGNGMAWKMEPQTKTVGDVEILHEMVWFTYFMWENRACLLGRPTLLEIGKEDERERANERESNLGPLKSPKDNKDELSIVCV